MLSYILSIQLLEYPIPAAAAAARHKKRHIKKIVKMENFFQTGQKWLKWSKMVKSGQNGPK